MPNKNLLIAGAVLLLIIVVGVVGFMMMSKSSKNSDAESAVAKDAEQEQSGVSATKESIKNLFSSGKNVTCTVTYPDNGGGGTMYIADKKMRGDFSTKDSSGKQIESHMILDGDTSYSWMGTQGVKMKIDSTVKASPAAGTTQQGTDLDKQQDMNCSSWSVDNSKFALPGDVKFTDMTGFLQQTQTQTQTQTGGTSACNAITDPTAKAACITATQSSGN